MHRADVHKKTAEEHLKKALKEIKMVKPRAETPEKKRPKKKSNKK